MPIISYCFSTPVDPISSPSKTHKNGLLLFPSHSPKVARNGLLGCVSVVETRGTAPRSELSITIVNDNYVVNHSSNSSKVTAFVPYLLIRENTRRGILL